MTAAGVDVAAARDFLLREARLLDRLRFEARFGGGSADAVLAALKPYQNADGGFGNALEPDLRGAASQPVPVEHALQILDEIGLFDRPTVTSACDWLLSVAPAGGVPFVLATVVDGPRAPWWVATGEPSLNPTAGIAGLLHKHGFDHPWLDAATAYCWAALPERVGELGGDDAVSVLTFLRYAPGHSRAGAIVDALGSRIRTDVVALDPGTPGYAKFPYDFAPSPQHPARRLFDDATVALHLDALAARQEDDGGWPITWDPPSAAARSEWRGFMTLKWLTVLDDYGRLR